MVQLKGSYLMLSVQKKHKAPRSSFYTLLQSSDALYRKHISFQALMKLCIFSWGRKKIKKKKKDSKLHAIYLAHHHSLEAVQKWPVLSYLLSTNMQRLLIHYLYPFSPFASFLHRSELCIMASILIWFCSAFHSMNQSSNVLVLECWCWTLHGSDLRHCDNFV